MATYISPDYGPITIPDNLDSGYTVMPYGPYFKELNPQLIDNGNGTYTNPYATYNAGYSDAALYRAQMYGITPDQAAADLGESRLSTPIDTWDPDRRRTGGGFDDFLSSYGWMLPAAIIGAGAASGALGAGAAATEGGVAGGTAGAAAGTNALDAYMASAGLDAGTFGAEAGGAASGYGLNAGAPSVGAYSPSGAAATQSSLGLGSAPTGLATSSVGMGGTTGAGSLAGITGSEAAAGLGGANLGTGLTASQLAQYEAGTTPSSISSSDINNARKLAQALTSKSGSQLIGSQLNGAAQNLATGQTGVGSAIPAIIRGNQNPFLQTAPQPIRNTSPDLAQLANLLKQG
jgi:hypothetical protein